MHLKLTLNGSVDPFVNYLKNFAKIRPSLLIEIDTKLKAFVAKTFSEDRASIRFSAISFDDCHIAVTAHENEKELGDNRIKTGILIQLPKLIKIVERFGSDVDDKGRPIYTLNTIVATIKQVPSLVKDLDDAERAIAKEIVQNDKIRGSAEKSMYEDLNL